LLLRSGCIDRTPYTLAHNAIAIFSADTTQQNSKTYTVMPLFS